MLNIIFFKKKILWIIMLILVLFSYPSLAQDKIPETSGFSGYLLTGPGVFSIESNLLVTGPPLLQDAGKAEIESIFKAPEAKLAFAWPFAGEINYTFAKSRTQIFLGNRLEDILRLDVPFGIGVRQELTKAGILAVSVLTTPTDLKFWSDPYVEGVERIETDLKFRGARLRWGEIFNTGLELTATMRWYRHKYEKSGEWLIDQGRLNPEKKHLLNRDGQVIRLQALYRIQLKRHRLEPTFRYVIDDHDGAAMANNGYSIKLTYIFLSKKVVLDANVVYGARKFRETHPVYQKTLEANRMGLALTAFIPIKVTDKYRLLIWMSGEIFREEANVDFFNSQFATIMGGIMYQHVRK